MKHIGRPGIAPLVVIALINLGLLVFAYGHALTGYEHLTEGRGIFWATFWASVIGGMLAGLVVTVVAGIILYRWQDAIARERAYDAAHRAVDTLHDNLRYELNQITEPTWSNAQQTVPASFHAAANILRSNEWNNWAHTVPGKSWWPQVEAFASGYAEFMAAASELQLAVKKEVGARRFMEKLAYDTRVIRYCVCAVADLPAGEMFSMDTWSRIPMEALLTLAAEVKSTQWVVEKAETFTVKRNTLIHDEEQLRNALSFDPWLRKKGHTSLT